MLFQGIDFTTGHEKNTNAGDEETNGFILGSLDPDASTCKAGIFAAF